MLRAMQSTDLQSVMRLGAVCFGASSHLRCMSFDDDKAAGFVSSVMGRGFAVVYERQGEVIGAMLGDVIAPWHSSDLMGVEYGLMVSPDHRGSPAASMLIQAWESWCEEMGACIVRLAVETEHDAAGKLYQKIGYRHAGGNFYRVL